jgi:hypothetical protein
MSDVLSEKAIVTEADFPCFFNFAALEIGGVIKNVKSIQLLNI